MRKSVFELVGQTQQSTRKTAVVTSLRLTDILLDRLIRRYRFPGTNFISHWHWHRGVLGSEAVRTSSKLSCPRHTERSPAKSAALGRLMGVSYEDSITAQAMHARAVQIAAPGMPVA